MTASINISITGNSAAEVRYEMISLLGQGALARAGSGHEDAAPIDPKQDPRYANPRLADADAADIYAAAARDINSRVATPLPMPEGSDAAKMEAKKRPSGRTRATAAEKAAEETRQISTNPEDRQETETDKADAVDEAADAAGQKGEAVTLTHDDVRSALGAYVKKFGMPAAQEDGPKVLALAMKKLGVELPKGETAWKISAVPDTQEALGAVIGGVTEMTDKNPFNREAVQAAK